MPEVTWHGAEVPAGQDTLPNQQGRELFCYGVTSSFPLLAQLLCLLPCLSATRTRESQSSSSQLLRWAPRSPQLLQKEKGIRAGGREQQWLCRARHISLPAEAPSPPVVSTGPRAGDTSLTWGTVQLFPCLAAALGLHLCPLAKEGDTDVTCRAAPEPKAGRLGQIWRLWLEHKAKPYPRNREQPGALGPCHAPNTEALCIPQHCASPGLPVLAPGAQQARAARETG